MRPDRPARLGAPSPLRAILQVTSGNFLEMFDFFLFGFFAKPIGDAFFPVADDVGRLLLSLVTFGAGFLMRPLGAVVLGAYIDRVGRRRGLIVTLAVMATGTVLIALTPGYRSFAAVSPSLTYAAPMLVLVGRLAQGFSAGVELGGVSVYLAEMAPPGRKGFFASWQSGSQQVAIVVAATLGVALETALAPDEIAAWGWRLPFLVGCSIVPLLFVLRRRLEETDEFKERTMRPSAREALRTLADNWRIVGLGTGMVAFTTVSFYVITVYAPTFGRQVLRLAATDTLLVTIAVGAANFVWLPIAGALSDRIGRKPILVAATAAALCTSYPAMTWLAASPSFTRMLTVELWLSLLFAAYNGAMIVALTEIVPVDVRTSGFSLAYSLATAVFGGFTPAISQELVRALADKAAPALWMSVASAISLAAVLVVYRSPPTSSRPAPSTPTRRAPPS